MAAETRWPYKWLVRTKVAARVKNTPPQTLEIILFLFSFRVIVVELVITVIPGAELWTSFKFFFRTELLIGLRDGVQFNLLHITPHGQEHWIVLLLSSRSHRRNKGLTQSYLPNVQRPLLKD